MSGAICELSHSFYPTSLEQWTTVRDGPGRAAVAARRWQVLGHSTTAAVVRNRRGSLSVLRKHPGDIGEALPVSLVSQHKLGPVVARQLEGRGDVARPWSGHASSGELIVAERRADSRGTAQITYLNSVVMPDYD